ncbi:MAG: GHKL domain-containing protein [Candidatus Omnitrophica bacterium]|nr:GHKL domain-containing protein [Candidatus Omnitrophota bacterium]
MLSPIFNPANYYWNPFSLPYYIVGFLTLIEGIFILSQNRRSLVNITYALSTLFVSLWLTGMGFVFSSLNQSIALAWARYYVFLGIIFLTPSIYFFSVSWQEDFCRQRQNRKRIITAASFFIGSLFYIYAINSPNFITGLWNYPWGFYPKAGSFYHIFLLFFFVLMILLLRNFISVYRKETVEIKKKQAKLIIRAFAIAYIGSVEFLMNYGLSYYFLAFLPVFICITIVGYSVIRYRAMDIETVVHKTIAWIFTNLVLIAPLAIFIYFSIPWYSYLNKIGMMVFLASISLLFLFFVRFALPKVDKFFQRQLYNLDEISRKFIDEAVHLKDIKSLIEHLKQVIADTLYSKNVDIYIYDETEKNYKSTTDIADARKLNASKDFLRWLAENDTIAYEELVDIDPGYENIKKQATEYFADNKCLVTVPLVLNEKLLGVINLSKKANLKAYNAADFHFLRTLKNQSAIAISNSLVYQNIEEEVKKRTEELVDVQKQLIQAGKLATVGTLAGGVAHEINNPLTAILTNVQLILADLEDELDIDEMKESLELVEEATKRCRTIVKKLMTYARKPVETSPVSNINVDKTIEKVIAFLGFQLEQDNVKIAFKSDKESYKVIGNQNEIEQVLTNIILNARDAIKRIKKSGVIDIALKKNDDLIEIEIKDEGQGMSEEVLSKIFDPFFTTKEIGKGLGLGLSICQSIIENHKGSISARSQLNRGSVFIIKLPKTQ